MVANITNTGYIFVNDQGQIYSIDQTVAKLLHVEASNALGRRLIEIFPDTRLLEVLVSHHPLLHEQVLNQLKVKVSYHPVVYQEHFLGVMILIDLEKLSIPEKENRALIDLYEGILSDLPLGYAVVNRQGRVVFMNEDYSCMLGCTPHDLIGLPLSKHVPFTRISEILRTGKSRLESELEFQGKLFLLSEAPIKAQGQTIGGISKILLREWIEGEDFRNLSDRIQVLENKILFYKEELLDLRSRRSPLDEIQGESPEMNKIKQVVKRIALHDANILITGESGTGKGLLAQTIHQLSPRHGEPFIKINCAAIPENLLESELFGYEEGAFTGAIKGGRPGKFELAQGGTIFLDEIGDMPVAMQAKILRVLQEKSFERIGGHKTLSVNVRVIAATHRDLVELIDQGEFRLDLYYRLAVISLNIPPLRERPMDICFLTEGIMQKLSQKYSKPIHGLTAAAEKVFWDYSWPGNVRELENVLEYAFNFLERDEQVIDIGHLPINIVNSTQSGNKAVPKYQCHKPQNYDCKSLEEAVAQAEFEAIRQALKLTRGNKQAAARMLGIHISGLYQKLKKYSHLIESCQL
ncbi:sigma-54 interaction domain-containing protein [Desulfitobacterium sp. Sab5]|uniref:sigma-54 interaction domain-containing protein n=1 Tax=Desulfitobacterium nosdiversum TaxID=3375356 RepID=UPI003CE724B4